ncbi:MAG: hypothetical protein KC620_02930 [Myxococcales bacterium]|nr:hypothetical protein [Myxococcales bacterium]
MKRLTLLLLGALLAPLSATAEPPPPSAELLLRAIDIPLTPERLEAAGLDEDFAAAALADAARDRYARVRALGALAVHGSPHARQLIEAAALADADEAVRAQALISLARAFGPDDRAAVTSFLIDRLPLATAAEVELIDRELRRLHP